MERKFVSVGRKSYPIKSMFHIQVPSGTLVIVGIFPYHDTCNGGFEYLLVVANNVATYAQAYPKRNINSSFV